MVFPKKFLNCSECRPEEHSKGQYQFLLCLEIRGGEGCLQLKERRVRESLQVLIPFKLFSAVSALKQFSDLYQNFTQFGLIEQVMLQRNRLLVCETAGYG